jgi:hypothetical protein
MGLSIFEEIFEELSAFGIPDDGAQRNGQDEVGCTSPFLTLAFPVRTSFGLVMLLVAKIEKCGELAIGPQDHASALSSVPAIGPSSGNVFFPAKTDAAVSSVSGLDEDCCLIDEFDRSNSRCLGG